MATDTSGGSRRPFWLLGLDVDRTQSYVFESARLPEVRGASTALSARCDGLPQVLRVTCDRRGIGHDLCYSAGGSLLCLVTDASEADVQAVAAELEDFFPRKLLIPTATTAYVGCDTDPRLNADEFRLGRRRLAHRLRRGKLARSEVPYFETMPFAQRCTSCDVRPASRVVAVPGEDEGVRAVCEACSIKLARGKGAKRGRLFARLLESMARQGDAWRDCGPVRHARDLNEIADSVGGNTIGAILLDGDGMGRELEALDWGATHRFSGQLETAMDAAVSRALSEGLQPAGDDGDRYLPAELVFRGGDDLFLIVPGQSALGVATEICRAFEDAANAGRQTEASHRLTLSGGVVIAHAHYPIYFLHRMAKELAGSAKRARRASASDADKGWIDFQVLRSGSLAAESLSALREAECLYDSEFRLRYLYDRPCSADRLQGLVRHAERLKRAGYPKGQLLMMSEALRQGVLEGSAFVAYQTARAAEGAREALARVLDDYCSPPGWCRREAEQETVHVTAIPDLADIYEFVGRSGEVR